MKVLHVNNLAATGLHLCLALRKKGIDAHLICRDNPYRDLNYPWIYLVNSKKDILCFKNLDLNKFDLIHCHYLTNFLSLILSFKKINCPILLHAHGSDTRPKNLFSKLIQRIVSRRSNILLHSTPDLLKNTKWFKGKRIYLPNISLIKEPKKTSKKYKDRVLLNATLHYVKKFENIFPLMQSSNLCFDVFNYGSSREYYRKIAPPNLHFIKTVEHKKLSSVLIKYGLVLGRQDGTIGVSEVESMMLGIPTLFPFEYNSFYPSPLVMPKINLQNLGKYFNDKDLGRKQRKWVEAYHGEKAIITKLIDIYKTIVNK